MCLNLDVENTISHLFLPPLLIDHQGSIPWLLKLSRATKDGHHHVATHGQSGGHYVVNEA